MIEKMIWLTDFTVNYDAFGTALMERGFPIHRLEKWMLDPVILGKSVFERMEGLDSEDCLESMITLSKSMPFIRHGQRFGYPDCCITDFLHRRWKVEPMTDLQQRIAQGSGFVPCNSCCAKVDAGEITLDGLLVDRKVKFSFRAK
jgi:hypothetical protein